ncbi:MAG: hypothetical protein EXX96DRAFT_557972 [Benjaminiella poitrasii]|nr:MAG: hypothetical protein EXX96DRAFT_557972 [Benjaminiella poitrasii]
MFNIQFFLVGYFLTRAEIEKRHRNITFVQRFNMQINLLLSTFLLVFFFFLITYLVFLYINEYINTYFFFIIVWKYILSTETFFNHSMSASRQTETK